MPQYKAPLRDMRFLMNEVFDYPAHYKTLPNGGEATPDMVDAILGECAAFCENVLAPLNQTGDDEGCTLTKTARSPRPRASRKPTSSSARAAGRAPASRSTAARACR